MELCVVWSVSVCFTVKEKKECGHSEIQTDNGLLWVCRWYCWDQRYSKAKLFDNNNVLSKKIFYLKTASKCL